MKKNFILVSTFAFIAAITASAQSDPSLIKGCARTMTNDMRNCGGGQQPQLKEKAKQAGESAQGFVEQSCNQDALNAYFACTYGGGYGVVKPLVPVATGDVAPRAKKTTVTTTTKKVVAPAAVK